MIDGHSEATDPALVQLVDGSVPFHAASRVGDHLVAAWQTSALARASGTWLAIPLDRRVRLVAVAAIVAVLTHVALTGFNAPEPTWWARATWAAVLLLTAAIGLFSRAIAIAWSGWAPPRSTRESVIA